MRLGNCLQEQNKLIFRALQTPSFSVSNSKCQMRHRARQESFSRQLRPTLSGLLPQKTEASQNHWGDLRS